MISIQLDDVLRVWDRWRHGLPETAFTHSQGVAFVTALKALFAPAPVAPPAQEPETLHTENCAAHPRWNAGPCNCKPAAPPSDVEQEPVNDAIRRIMAEGGTPFQLEQRLTAHFYAVRQEQDEADAALSVPPSDVLERPEIERLLRAEYEREGIALESYVAGPRGDRFETVEGHSLDAAVEIIERILQHAARPAQETAANVGTQVGAALPSAGDRK